MNHRSPAASDGEHVVVAIGTERIFGCDDELLSSACYEFAQQTLRLSELISIGSIDEIPARIGIALKDAPGFVSLGSVAPRGSKVAGAEN
jgi:hypothetical protein